MDQTEPCEAAFHKWIPVEFFSQENYCKENNPHPEAGSMNDEKSPIKPVVEMRKVEDL